MRTSIFKGERISLTALHKEDLPHIVKWHQDATFLRLLDAVAAKPKTLQEIEKWYENNRNSNNGYLFGIRDHEEQLLGYVELDGILWNQRNGWLSIAIGADHQGKGLGKEAMQLLLRFAFDELNLHRVQLTVFENNDRAIRLYESLGFTKEGAHREFLYRDGKNYDMFLYGLLRREWDQTK
ncbi:GNAT family N-acetyltransferase [Pontibacillus marinus]|nr:GNAT family protein [Pontibacillus marinus]